MRSSWIGRRVTSDAICRMRRSALPLATTLSGSGKVFSSSVIWIECAVQGPSDSTIFS
jgi:hypothetical protein